MLGFEAVSDLSGLNQAYMRACTVAIGGIPGPTIDLAFAVALVYAGFDRNAVTNAIRNATESR